MSIARKQTLRPDPPRSFKSASSAPDAASTGVLEELHKGLRQALVENRDPLIILEDLVLLKDSVSNLLKSLCREIVGYPRTVSFWETSGITEAFMSAMDAPPAPGNPPPAAS